VKRILILFVITLALLSGNLHAQGCTQCRDNAAATPPATQRGYRHAIILLTVTAAAIFTGSVLMLRRRS